MEDNKDLLFNLELILKANDFAPILAKNGREALDRLAELDKVPDLIISDIFMPQMNGYQFFKKISDNPSWNRIPFIFLTARAKPEDIRLGKLLGADDYITKPFDEKDLLASINGRLERNKRILAIEKEFTLTPKIKITTPHIKRKEDEVRLLLVFWDDKLGPYLKDYYPKKELNKISLNDISNQLFSAAISIYGQNKMTKAEGALLRVANFKTDAYLFFDAYKEENERYGEKQFMLAVIASKISYFHSFEIKQVLRNLSEKIKNNEKANLNKYWKEIFNILIKSVNLYE